MTGAEATLAEAQNPQPAESGIETDVENANQTYLLPQNPQPAESGIETTTSHWLMLRQYWPRILNQPKAALKHANMTLNDWLLEQPRILNQPKAALKPTVRPLRT